MVSQFKRSQSKGYSDFVTIESRKSGKNYRLRLNFSTDVSPKYWGKSQQRVSAKMLDTPENIATLEAICNQMYLDYLRDDFDPSLQRYLPHLKPLDNVVQFPTTQSELTIGELWDKYNEYDLAGKKETTIKQRKSQYNKIQNHINKPLSQEVANDIRKDAIEDGTQNSKGALATLQRAVDWAVRQDTNPV